MSKHFVLDENHNLIDAYSAQEVLSVLEQAIADGSLADVVAGQAIIDKLKCCVSGDTHQVAFITQAKYNELKASGSLVEGGAYFITDDDTVDVINATVQSLQNRVTKILDGSQTVPNASNATTADVVAGTYFEVDITSGVASLNDVTLEHGAVYMVDVYYAGSKTTVLGETHIKPDTHFTSVLWYFNSESTDSDVYSHMTIPVNDCSTSVTGNHWIRVSTKTNTLEVAFDGEVFEVNGKVRFAKIGKFGSN